MDFFRRRAGLLLAVAVSGVTTHTASAQFLRIGPLDFAAVTTLQGVYTTNVENQRKSAQTAEPKDYYLIGALDLNSVGDLAPSTTLKIDTGISVEKHFMRPDLDNSSSPFGKLRVDSLTELSHWLVNAFGNYERTSQSADNTYVPNQTKTRDVNDKGEYGGSLRWETETIKLGAKYDYETERHQDPQFMFGNKDTTTLDYDAAWYLREDLSLRYKLERKKDVLVTTPDAAGSGKWLDTTTIDLDWRLPILERPSLTYSLGIEKADQPGQKGTWEPKHMLNLMDDRDLNPRLHLQYFATYTHAKQLAVNDIALTYGASLVHDISATAQQSLKAERDPVTTLGSTTDTDMQKYSYTFHKTDLFIYNLTLDLLMSYEIDKPLDKSMPEEDKWIYGVNLQHQIQVSRNLTRTLAYKYKLEKSNLFPHDDIQEHRVELTYTYTF